MLDIPGGYICVKPVCSNKVLYTKLPFVSLLAYYVWNYTSLV